MPKFVEAMRCGAMSLVDNSQQNSSQRSPFISSLLRTKPHPLTNIIFYLKNMHKGFVHALNIQALAPHSLHHHCHYAVMYVIFCLPAPVVELCIQPTIASFTQQFNGLFHSMCASRRLFLDSTCHWPKTQQQNSATTRYCGISPYRTVIEEHLSL